jgi:hypothetical protein
MLQSDPVDVWIEAHDGARLPGVDERHAIEGSESTLFAPARAVHIYRPEATRVHRDVRRLHDLEGARRWLWPCDYRVDVDGRQRVARWDGRGWALQGGR